MGKPVRFGIVGAGVIGAHHAQVLAQNLALTGAAALVAVADAEPGRAEQLAAKYGAAACSDYRALLGRPDVDAVAVCTPSGLHAEHAVAALEAGKHVLIEKPVEIALPAIDRLVAAWQRSGRVAAVISQHRFAGAVRTIEQLIAAERFGRLVHADAAMKWWRSQAYYDSVGWRGTLALDGGGCMMNQGIHTIDLLQWLLAPAAGRVAAVTAYTGTLLHERIEVEDSAVALLRFESGAVGTLSFTVNAYPGLSTRLELHGGRGSAVLVNEKLDYLFFERPGEAEAGPYGGGGARNLAPEFAADGEGSAGGAADPAAIVDRHTAQYLDFLEAVAQGRPPLNTPAEARRPVEIILACYESARTGREVRLAGERN
jgi:UDP-N-acetyl-2-amino-2-deoxyglucuronate dehydrogenase